MVYTAILGKLSFKSDLSDDINLLDNQASTYAILKYAGDIPTSVYKETMSRLIDYKNNGLIEDQRLFNLICEYEKVSLPIMEFTEEIEESIEIDLGFLENRDNGYRVTIEQF